MYKSKLLRLLGTLSAEEWRGFKKFANSPTHNRHKGVVKLLDFIMSRKSITPESVSKEDAWNYLFPKEDFDNMRIIHLMSYLSRVLEGFLAYTEWRAEQQDGELRLIRSLRKRQQGKPFGKKVENFRETQQKSLFRNAAYHYHRYQLESEYYKYISEQHRTISSNLQEISDNLDHYFIAEKLKQACEIFSHKNVVAKEYDLGLLPATLQLIEQHPRYLDIPAISLYYYGYRILCGNSETDFKCFKMLVENHKGQFPQDEARNLHLIAINFSIRQLNKGNTIFLGELFDLYLSGLDTAVFLREGVLSRLTYINIVSVGLKLKRFDWVREFIPRYKGHLNEHYRESMYAYNQAKLHYSEGQYKEAMLLLLHIDFDDLLIHLDSKLMLLKMYYELGETEALEALIDSFRTYLHRKKVVGYHRSNYTNILSIMKRLIYLNHKDNGEIEGLRKFILSKEILTEREWFLKKLGGES